MRTVRDDGGLNEGEVQLLETMGRTGVGWAPDWALEVQKGVMRWPLVVAAARFAQ